MVVNPSVQPGSRASLPGVRLTAREREILRLMAADLTNAQIAEQLVVTAETVRWYTKQIYSKLDAHSRDEAVQIAQDLHLLRQPASLPDQAEPAHPSYIPLPATPLVGREAELDDVCNYLLRDDIRLVTLTGPPGIGKTTLSLHAAARLKDKFTDGAFFVGLAPLTDPALVANGIAQVLGVSEFDGQPIIDTLKSFLRKKHVLLVLDNFEHVLTAARLVADLLASATGLKVLATSREQLHLYGEHEYMVPPLALPDLHEQKPIDSAVLGQSEAVMLFVQRAQAVKHSFELTTKNASTIADICSRLDGLPLAIELAAARIKLYPPEELRQRLTKRLNTLTGGARNLPERHQTLRGAIAWSYDLLNADEQKLFSHLGVFVGGWTLEAMEAICSIDLPINVYDGLESLLNKSLVQQTGSDGSDLRFTMLETIREYALEKLVESGTAEVCRVRHARFFIEMVEHTEPLLRTADRMYWITQLRAEDGNIRSILHDLAEHRPEAETAIRMAAALWHFWAIEGRYHEGINWLERLLPRSTNMSPALRAKALHAAATLENYIDNWARSVERFQEALELGRSIGDAWICAHALAWLGRTHIQPGSLIQKHWLDESLSLATALGDPWLIATSLVCLGSYYRRQADHELSRTALEKALEWAEEAGLVLEIGIFMGELGETAAAQGNLSEAKSIMLDSITHLRKTGNAVIVGMALGDLGDVERLRGDLDSAQIAFEEALTIWQEFGSQYRETRVLFKLGYVAFHQKHIDDAETRFRQSLRQAHQHQFLKDMTRNIALALAGFAKTAADRNELLRAVTLLGAAHAQLQSIQRTFGQLTPADRAEVDSLIAVLQSELDISTYSKYWEIGADMTLDQAVVYALESEPPSS